jgi:hypothetical protein
MRRLLLALFAFLLGFGGAIAAAQLTGAANTRSQGYPLGAIDFDQYCQSMYGERAIPLLSRPTASGWQCNWRPNGIFAAEPVDFDQACAVQYGAPAFAQVIDPDWPYSWQCRYGSAP